MGRGGRTVAATATVLGLVLGDLGGGVLPAAGQQRVDEQIRSLRDQAGLATAEEARLLDLIDAADARQKELKGTVAQVNRQVSRLRNDLDSARSSLRALEARQRALEGLLGEATRALEAAKERTAQIALAAYTGRAGFVRYATNLLYSADFSALATRRSYQEVAVNGQERVIASEEKLRDRVGDLLEELEGTRREVQTYRAAIEGQGARAASEQRAQAGLLAEAQAEVTERTRLVNEVVARRAEFESELANLQKESEAIARELRARQATDDGPVPTGDGQLGMPVPGARLGSAFGLRVHPVYGDLRMHTGVDIGAPSGAAIRAAEAGTVVTATWMSGYGNATIIDHGNGLATLYAHQSQINVSVGQRVSRGQVIGRVGCTGTCTGPHLHFEVRVRGTPVNPASYLA